MKPYNWPKTNLFRLLVKKHLERKGYFFLQIFTHCDVNTGVQKLWISTKMQQLLGWVWEKLAEDNFKTCCEAPTAQGDIGPLCIFSFFFCYCVFLFHLLSYIALPTACSYYVLVHTILCYVGSPSKTSPRYRLRCCSRNVLCPIFRVSFHRLIFRPIFERPLYMIKILRKGALTFRI